MTGHLRIALLALAILLSACSASVDLEHEGAAGTGDVGAACLGDEECVLELACLREAPDGYCTRTCSEVDACPEGSRCIRFATEVGEHLGCVTPCDPQDAQGCRSGYQCKQVGTTALHVCTW